MLSLSLVAPAKVNLFLHITGQREDGYHELQTLFQLLDYGDHCQFTLNTHSPRIEFTTTMTGVAHEDNLAFKAATLLQKHSQCRLGATIHIDKKLPSGAGLGGGSSNAASTLVALNTLWQTGLNADELAELGLALGADVPIFVKGNTAWAEGIGEKLTPTKTPEHWYLVINPGCHVSTSDIFCSPRLTRDTPAITVAAFLKQGGRNDCQPVVVEEYPKVKYALAWLQGYADSQLTGTGACVFASFSSFEEAQIVYNEASTRWQCFIAKGVNHSATAYLLG